MREKPTTFQLAQLAAQAGPPNTKAKDAIKRAMELWGEAETTIAEFENRTEYLRRLFKTPDGKDIPIFTDSPEHWCARLNAYPGDEREVDRTMWDHTLPAELVGKQLFRDRTLTKELRRKLLVGLARASVRLDMEGPPVPYKRRLSYLEGEDFIAPEEGFPIHPKNLERARNNYGGVGKMLIPGCEVKFVKETEALLSRPNLYAHLVRWVVEVRQKQIQESKSRVIPESLRQQDDKGDREDSIQFKKPYRQ
jgi:hypothetical protein